MKKISTIFIVLTVMSLMFLAACGNGEVEENDASASSGGTENNAEVGVDQSDWPEKLRFAATDMQGLEELQLEFEPFRAKLEEVLGIDVEFFAISNRTTAITALEYDQVDVLFAGGAEYVLMREADENTKPVAALTRPGYLPLIIAHEDRGIETIEDLKGKSIAMDNVGSTSAYLMPSKMLLEAGFDLDKDITTHLLGKSMYDAFIVGETDALTLTELNYEGLVEEQGEGKYNVVAEGELLPNDLIVASPHLPASFVEHMETAIIEYGEDLLEQILITGENDKFSESKFIHAEDSDYDDLRDAYELLGVDYK